MKTVIKTIGNQEYICFMTNDISKGDFIIQTFTHSNKLKESSINKVVYANKTSNLIRYDKISGDGNHSFGFESFRSMTDLTRYMGRKCNMELDILHAKIVGIGVIN